ncbi:DUF6478 family protein [Ruegeria sp. Ofav3-42]|uniref:DUF6478 family protein n=1 Tax=Ruegeria sp. Ofav3-42 TaxID=2917759 RepID=UPI001EF60EC7|nr:DUF6478 family protein [Ruegeria sp. Ofav3-42]MCG7521585.1 DUF6478 family protein [Ruegeria sp. Ofav3-42]
MGRLLDRYLHRKTLARWRQVAQGAVGATTPQLRQQRDEARKLRVQLDRLIHEANTRLTRPVIGSTQFPKPLGTDWSWRPDLWRNPLPQLGTASIPRRAELDRQVGIFHDCTLSEIGVRQSRNTDEKDLAAFGLSVEVFGFSGTFLSLSLDLPPEAAQGLTRQHLIRVDALIKTERPLEIIARLNIQHGPNTDSVPRALDLSVPSNSLDFDLAKLPLNERRIDKIWLDLVLSYPAMNRVVIRDLTFCRHHRADL